MKVNIVRPQPIKPKLTKYIVVVPDAGKAWLNENEINELIGSFIGEIELTATYWRYVIINTEKQTIDYLDHKPNNQTTFVCLSEFNESQYWANAFDHLNIRFGNVRDEHSNFQR